MSHVDDGLLHAYLDGELSPAETQGVDAHLAQCPDCRHRLEEERALIARAAELLALATPPDRALPAFRAGDVKPPTRLWWEVRLPLAWAATVALALGIGTYLGRGVEQVLPTGTAADANPARPLAQRGNQDTRAKVRALVRKPAAPPPAPFPARALTDSIAPQREESREPLVARGDTAAAPAAYADRALGSAAPGEPNRWERGNAITFDSARLVLGSDPLVVPGVPIEAVYQGRRLGYTGVVIVEQALDASTMIQVINARTAPMFLNDVVVTGSQPVRSPPAQFAPRLAPQPSVGLNAGLFHAVQGPVPADSLAALRRRLQPLRPATGP
jgi:hypothetical protein